MPDYEQPVMDPQDHDGKFTVVLLLVDPEQPYDVETGGVSECVEADGPQEAVDEAAARYVNTFLNVTPIAVYAGHLDAEWLC